VRLMYLDNTNLAFDLELDVCVSFGRRHFVCKKKGDVDDTINFNGSTRILKIEENRTRYCLSHYELAES
jgi:hypothetical protein